ncbi:MAG: hypothetical protein K6T86_08195 [Pirellulales bacterium]|nr:hypothetical protein [Pirellulales bacterium]
MSAPLLHQPYQPGPPTSRYQLLAAPPCPAPESEEGSARLARTGDLLRAAHVSVIYLLHGTFAGYDALGALVQLERWLPRAHRALVRQFKGLVDRLQGEAANYTPQYAALLQRQLTAGGPPIAVRRFLWSSGNYHLARADAAVRLIDELATTWPPEPQRVLLWGHSHGGNVLALVTQLLGGQPEQLSAFFTACEPFYRNPLTGRVDIPVWQRVRQALLGHTPPASDDVADRQRPVAAPTVPRPDPSGLDIVTLGTPVRYGWQPRGFSRLLHIIHHRPVAGREPWQAAWPPTLADVQAAAGGDYVQQFGIAGTNTPPSWIRPRLWLAERRLHRLLQPHLRARELPARLALGIRVHNAGTTLLVDYGPETRPIYRHLAGHAVYTEQAWMVFHAEEIAQRLYAEQGGEASG